MINAFIFGCITLTCFILAGNGLKMFFHPKSQNDIGAGAVLTMFSLLAAAIFSKVFFSYLMEIL